MSEIKPTLEQLSDPYVLQLIEALGRSGDEVERLTERVVFLEDEIEGYKIAERG